MEVKSLLQNIKVRKDLVTPYLLDNALHIYGILTDFLEECEQRPVPLSKYVAKKEGEEGYYIMGGIMEDPVLKKNFFIEISFRDPKGDLFLSKLDIEDIEDTDKILDYINENSVSTEHNQILDFTIINQK